MMFDSVPVYENRLERPAQTAVTVAVSLYNYEDFVIESLDSIPGQTLQGLDLIIVDDASTDRSVEVVTAWARSNAKRFRRVLIVRHPRNRGLAEARNTAFRLAETDYVFVLDSDNLLYPRCLERLLKAVTSDRYGAAYSQIERFGSIKGLCWSDYWHKDNFIRMNYIDAMALVSVDAWRRVGGYTHIEGGWEDYDFWCKFIDQGIEALFLPEILCRYRVHEQSMLRTETLAAATDLAVRMMLRHPWLSIETD